MLDNGGKRIERLGLKVTAGTISVVVFFIVFFLIAGRFDWLRGWAYLGLSTIGKAVSDIYVWRKNPELIRRRSKFGKGTKRWDILLLGLFGLTYLGILIVAALDERYHWSAMSMWLWLIGCILYVLFFVFITWTMVVNPYFEKTVRIQRDLGHRVIDSGPYRIVRHPGYLMTILGFILSAPLLLGSWWAMLPAMLATLCLVIRTDLEDRTLCRELSGYEAYIMRVRYRLLPGVW